MLSIIKTEKTDFDLLDKKLLEEVKDNINIINSTKKPEITHFTDKIRNFDKLVQKCEKKNS